MRSNSHLFEKDLLVTIPPGFFWVLGFLLLTALSAFGAELSKQPPRQNFQIAQPNLVSTGYCTKGVSVNASCPDILKETPTSFQIQMVSK
jgi:hypothetical protein